MRDYTIVINNTSDLPVEYIQEHGLKVMFLPYTIDGVTYESMEDSLSDKEFYDKMRAGSMPSTSQATPAQAAACLEPLLQEGKDVLCIAFSSGLSGTYQSICLAVQDLQEKYPDATIRVVDSLCASMGEGLFVHKAVMLKEAGKSLDEVAQWLEENKLHLCHNFTVDDLFFLHKGGRVSKTTAIVGSALGIKPVLHVDDEGKLVPVGKVRGRKQSLIALVDRMVKQVQGVENDMVFISHGDCLQDAEFVRDLVREKTGVQNFMINYIGPTIGAHSGPGTVALFFMGQSR